MILIRNKILNSIKKKNQPNNVIDKKYYMTNKIKVKSTILKKIWCRDNYTEY